MNIYKTLVILFTLTVSFTSSAQWDTENLPDGRARISSVAIGDNIYFVGGGTDGTLRYFKMNIFNVPTKNWTTVEVPDGTIGCRTIAINQKIYFGDVEGNRTIYVYDTEAEIWDQIKVPGFIGTLTHMDNKLIVEDGGDLMIYDIDEKEWTDFDFDYKEYTTVAAANGKIVLAGGSPNIVRIYDVESDSWTESQLSIEREDPKAVSHGNRLFFIGGEADRFFWTGRIDIFDTESNTWSIDSLSVDRNRFSATVHNDKLIIAGGQVISFSGQWRKEVDIFDLRTNSWETIEMPTGRRYPSIVGHEDKLYIAGGDNDQDNLDIIEVYTLPLSTNTKELVQQDISLYPNPTTQRLILKTAQNVGLVEILDIHGRTRNSYPNQHGPIYDLDVSNLNAGVYFLRTNKKGRPLRFLKQE